MQRRLSSLTDKNTLERFRLTKCRQSSTSFSDPFFRSKSGRFSAPAFCVFEIEHFQQKCEAVLRGIMRTNNELERFHHPVLTGTALAAGGAF
jgi:hypothetical protein